jgi:DNA-binding NarL/FixJ family response regulator
MVYLPQELPAAERSLSVYDFFAAEEAFWDAEHRELRELARSLTLPGDVFYSEQAMDTLSGGERIKLSLARLLLTKPDVLLLDINMPGLSGLEVVKQLKQADCETRVIALTIHDSDNYILEMLKNGALGYLLKDVEPAVLIKAIHVVNGGDAFVYPELAERLFGSATVSEDVEIKAREMLDESRGERLTAREMDVLECVAKGFSNQDIAKALGLSEKTVKNHMTRVLRKLKVEDRTQALVYVLKNKIISLD